MTIGELIYNRRKELGLTLEEVGNAVGVSKSTVKKWENGFIANMRRDKIEKLSKVLQISPTALLGMSYSNKSMETHITIRPNDKELEAELNFVKEEYKKRALAEDSESKEIKEIKKKLNQLSDSDIIKLSDFIDYLLSRRKKRTDTHSV